MTSSVRVVVLSDTHGEIDDRIAVEAARRPAARARRAASV